MTTSKGPMFSADEVKSLDLRRQKQIQNQVRSIERLLDDPSAAPEIARLNDELTKVQQENEELQAKLGEKS